MTETMDVIDINMPGPRAVANPGGLLGTFTGSKPGKAPDDRWAGFFRIGTGG